MSIVIPVFNKFALTYACVKSVTKPAPRCRSRSSVDDCSRDETMLASFAFGSGIRLIPARSAVSSVPATAGSTRRAANHRLLNNDDGQGGLADEL